MARPRCGLRLLALSAALVVLVTALQAAADQAGGQQGLLPEGRHIRRLAGGSSHPHSGSRGRCAYTPALIFGRGFGTDVKEELAAGLIRSCDSTRLDSAQQAECRACERQRTKSGCLKQTARVYTAVDQVSCAWIESDGTLEARWALGVNFPPSQNYLLDPSTCAVRTEWELPASKEWPPAYKAGLFEAEVNGLGPNGSLWNEIPLGLNGDASCYMETGRRSQRCSKTAVVADNHQFLTVAKTAYILDPQITEQLKRTNYTLCRAGDATGCPGATPKFRFTLRLTELPCRRGERRGQVAVTEGPLPLGRPEPFLWPSANAFDGITSKARHHYSYLEGARHLRWTTRAERDVAVAVWSLEDFRTGCRNSTDNQFRICDYTTPAMRAKARSGTYCHGRKCSGSLVKPTDAASDEFILVTTYPRVTVRIESYLTETDQAPPPLLVDYFIEARR